MFRINRIALAILTVLCAAALPALSQVTSPIRPTAQAQAPAPNANGEVYGGYMIGVGDILDIHVNDEDAVSGRYQVDQNGSVKLPLLTGSIPAAGASTFDLAARLSDEFKKQQILREPSVTVLMVRGMTQNVSVLGAVMRPGTYPIEKATTTLMDVISQAGGLAANAGNSVTISHGSEGSAPHVANASVKTSEPVAHPINLNAVMTGKDPSGNLTVHAGDIITISSAPVIFVVGAVTKPGAFTVQDQNSRMTVLQAIAMAEGPTSTASLGRTIIIRQSASDADRSEIPIDLSKMIKGKEKDSVLEANDILFVPQSGLKASLHTMGQIGAQAAGYGLGLRIAP